ncbi:unnamed protein product [Adineta ricciae]|uniref:G-protein coupled receptors family 1 profile domain-containing protein n=1 Tax=Adineta ricciae TaxID=249248 RepID=A0A815L6M3_ADIRI|nr:unnamed protein product [Adineta ricciae]CAF1405304.1 unnamed protein product [Adineta ricciae]
MLYTSMILLCIGTIGNVLKFIIFAKIRSFRGNQCAYYLKISSITDTGVLVATLPFLVVDSVLGIKLVELSPIWCKIQLMFIYTCGLYSVFTMCCIALDQYLSTNHRQTWRQMSTIQLAQRLSYFNMSVAVFHGILFLIFANYGIGGCSIYNHIAQVYFTYFYYPILSGILPIIVSGTFSLLAYRNVRRIIRRQIPVVRRRLDRQMTALALSRVLCIIILGVPFLCYSLVDINSRNILQDPVEQAVLHLSATVVYSFMYLNYSINFYIFLIISPRFRHQVKNFVMKNPWHQMTRVCNRGIISPVNNQVIAPENNPGGGGGRASALESI